jgi:hypothetical protein
MISFRSPLTPDAVEFLTEETRVDFGMQDMRHWFCATAWNDTGSVIGVLACEPKTWFDWHWSCAVADPHVLSRRLLRTIFRTLFKAGAVRITALIEPSNEQAIKSVRRLGFVYEGFLRMGIEGDRDALVFGMLEGDCRWLHLAPHSGLRAPSTIIRTDIGAPNGLFS